mgnify:CR=1 FL=1
MSSIKHVAIIMDGNGRWAKMRKRPRVWGHIRGARKVSEIVEASSELGLESLTLYTFSTENWSRPTQEVKTLFKLLRKFLEREKTNLIQNNIKFNVIGNYQVLDSRIVNMIEDLKEETRDNSGLELSLAINYGGRAEVVDAVNKFLAENRKTREIREEDISDNLYSNKIREIDLMIRTGGDKRISNFLLWELCYAEMFFTDTKWPEFSKDEFKAIIAKVAYRERRFGGLVESNETTIENNKRH